MSEEKKGLGVEIIPEAKDKITAEDANKVRVLVQLDLVKFEQQKAQLLRTVADCDLAIAQQKVILADLDRRVEGVDYPVPEKPAEAEAPKAPAMGEPVGPEAGK